MREEGTILLIVLIALALLAAIAGLVLRLAQTGIETRAAEAALFRREVRMQSALAFLGAALPDPHLPEDGSEVTVDLPGGPVALRLLPAEGLLNPNTTREPVLAQGLVALGATPEQGDRIAAAIVEARQAGDRQPFGDLAQVAVFFRADVALWRKVAPYITLLGNARAPDAASVPPALRGIAEGRHSVQVDFSDLGTSGGQGFYEIWLHVVGPADARDPGGRLWTHVSALIGADRRLRVLSTGWPEPMEAMP